MCSRLDQLPKKTGKTWSPHPEGQPVIAQVNYLTISDANTLTLSREIQSFSHSHFRHVEIILANVCCGFGRHKLREVIAIVRHPALNLQVQFHSRRHRSVDPTMKADAKDLGLLSSRVLTLRSGLSRPARARSNVVFPDPGGPRSSVILHTTPHQWFPHCWVNTSGLAAFFLKTISEMQKRLTYRPGFTMPLMSSSMGRTAFSETEMPIFSNAACSTFSV